MNHFVGARSIGVILVVTSNDAIGEDAYEAQKLVLPQNFGFASTTQKLQPGREISVKVCCLLFLAFLHF